MKVSHNHTPPPPPPTPTNPTQPPPKGRFLFSSPKDSLVIPQCFFRCPPSAHPMPVAISSVTSRFYQPEHHPKALDLFFPSTREYDLPPFLFQLILPAPSSVLRNKRFNLGPRSDDSMRCCFEVTGPASFPFPQNRMRHF